MDYALNNEGKLVEVTGLSSRIINDSYNVFSTKHGEYTQYNWGIMQSCWFLDGLQVEDPRPDLFVAGYMLHDGDVVYRNSKGDIGNTYSREYCRLRGIEFPIWKVQDMPSSVL